MANAQELYKWTYDLLMHTANQRAHMAHQLSIMRIMLQILEEDELLEELHARVQESTGEPYHDMLIEYSIVSLSAPDLGVADNMLRTLRNIIAELDEKQAFLEASMNVLQAKGI